MSRTPIPLSSNLQPSYYNEQVALSTDWTQIANTVNKLREVALLKYFIFAHSALPANTFDFRK
jgi:hypothetical protein